MKNMGKLKIIFTAGALLAALMIGFAFPAAAEAPERTVKETESLSSLAERYREILKSGEKRSVSDFLKNEESETADASLDFSEDIDRFCDSVPDEIKDRLPYIKKLADGGVLDPYVISVESFGKEAERIISDSSGIILKNLPRFLIIIVLSYILCCAARLFGGKTADAAEIIVLTVIALQFFKSGIVDIESLSSYLEALTKTAQALTSLLVSVLIAGGSVTSAAVASGAISVICTVVHYLFSNVVMPLISMSLALSVAGSTGLCPFADSLGTFLRKSAVWITVIVSTVSTFVLALQSVLARSADTVGIKTVKFAVGSFVPIVGGAVSETVNTVSAGLSYIKNTCGAVGVAVLIFIVLPPIASLFASKIALMLSSGAAGLFECKKEQKILSSLSGTVDSLIALFICSGASFIIFIISIISCSLAIGG